MITKKATKLYLGKYISLKDYDVQEAKDRVQDILVLHDKEQMLIKFEDLDKGIKDTKHHSKYTNKTYFLINFLWKPDKKKPSNPDQMGLLEGGE